MRIDESYLARRRFLCGMLGGGAGALAAGVAVPLGFYVGNLHEEPPPPFVIIPADDCRLPPGKAKLVMYGRIPTLLIRTPEPNSVWRAFVATCTHFDCTVGYSEAEQCIVCACHGGYYDLEGRPTAGPPPRPLRPLCVGLRDGNLVLALEKANLDQALSAPDA
jgi:nitrite reductase/ring-hydroxylating ferredoxin subunit